MSAVINPEARFLTRSMPPVFTGRDKAILRNHMKCTGYDKNVGIFVMGYNYHANEDVATISVPYSDLSKDAQIELCDFYHTELYTFENPHDVIPNDSVVNISLNVEWGPSVTIVTPDEEVTLNHYGHNNIVRDRVLNDLFVEAEYYASEKTREYIEQYQEAQKKGDVDRCKKMAHDFAVRYGCNPKTVPLLDNYINGERKFNNPTEYLDMANQLAEEKGLYTGKDDLEMMAELD